LKNIILIGFMGTGKSEVGKQVAQRLGWSFIDTDRLIEQEAGMPIAGIFERLGELRFREMERGIVRKMASIENAVIATGGGAVVDSGNMRALRRNGWLICLEAAPEAILSRTAGSDRPLLKGGKPAGRIKQLLAERKPYYDQADAVVKTTGRDIKEITEEVLQTAQQMDESRIRVDLADRGYDIQIGSGILSEIGLQVKKLGITDKVALVTNPRVGKLYGRTVMQSLKRAGFTVRTIRVPEGERYKSLRWAAHIYDTLVRHRFERGSCLIALGGGVIGDLTGFAAATYLRGIPYIQVPTTLAAQVDASIGGKTAVNHPMGKNLIGAFYQPRLVWIDTQVLKTLSKREYISGLAEVIKYGVIADAAFFKLLEERMPEILSLDDAVLRQVIKRSCEIKAGVVQEDERERDKRRILNYGHTLGHAIEATTHYRQYLHGEGVAMGMVFAARLARELGLSDNETMVRQVNLIKRAGLPVSLPRMRLSAIFKTMALDKKVKERQVYFVLPEAIGQVVIRPVAWEQIEKVIRSG
jgi:3-dehydroquinate synthase